MRKYFGDICVNRDLSKHVWVFKLLSFYSQFHFERFVTNQRRPRWGGAAEEISAFRKVFKKGIGDYDDEGSVGVGGGSYGDGGANGGANGGGGSDKGGDGDGGGDDGDGATPLVTAIRGSPSPLSHRTGCCGNSYKIVK